MNAPLILWIVFVAFLGTVVFYRWLVFWRKMIERDRAHDEHMREVWARIREGCRKTSGRLTW